MSTNSSHAGDLAELAHELTLARATDLARSGHYGDAEALLAADTSAVALDLRARMHAQQGKLAEAEECWVRAAEVGGDGAGFHAERHRIAALQRRRLGPWWLSLPLRRMVAGVLAAGLAVAVVLVAAPRLGATETATLRGQLDRINGQLAALGAQGAVPPARAADGAQLMSTIAADLPASTLLVRPDPRGLSVIFQVPLFTETSARMTPQGEAMLADLGHRLARHAPDISIRVVGHTNDLAASPGGQDQGNAELGLSRALAAARQLSAASGIPLRQLAVASAGADTPPFPNTGAENRAKNRTVTVEIAPA